MSSLQLESLFPLSDQIPAEYALTEPLEQQEYLVGGIMKAWNGNTQAVYSPIYTRTAEGAKQMVIFSFITDFSYKKQAREDRKESIIPLAL